MDKQMDLNDLIKFFSELRIIDGIDRQALSADTRLYDDLMIDSFTAVLLLQELEGVLQTELDCSVLIGVSTIGELHQKLQGYVA